jgi:hypothetical protein
VVKDAQHNAMINTLLDMFLTANPEKARTQDDKDEMAKTYKPGQNILPQVNHRRKGRRRREQEDSARRERHSPEHSRNQDRRELSEAPPPSQVGDLLSPRSANARSRSRSQDRTQRIDHDERRERRMQERQDRRTRRERDGGDADESRSDLGHSEADDVVPDTLSLPVSSPRHPDAVEARQRGVRTVAHQASLRSLVSASDSGTGTGDSLDEAQLMQDILAEGLLDGIDVERLTEAEQDELSEIIAQRYRELHPNRGRRTQASPQPVSTPNINDPATGLGHLRVSDSEPRDRRRSTGDRRGISPRPRINASDLWENTPPSSYVPTAERDRPQSSGSGRQHRRRASDNTSRPEVRGHRSTHPVPGRSSATRSATDLAGVQIDESSPRRLSSEQRASTEPRRASRNSRQMQISNSSVTDSTLELSPAFQGGSVVSRATTARSPPQTEPVEMDGASAVGIKTTFEEPSVKCYRCNRQGIQYDVHKRCAPCGVDLCMRCFRSGRGCNHWFGFGHAADAKFASSHPKRSSQAMELPHRLVGRQYSRPPADLNRTSEHGNLVTTSDPADRLQEGQFCDRCGAFANASFWLCDCCNDGEWGFCSDCVNTHHCCNHPLLPIAHKLFAPGIVAQQQTGSHTNPYQGAYSGHDASFVRPLFGKSSPAHSAPSSATSATDGPTMGPLLDFVNLSITTNCDICAVPIGPTDSRYHCPAHPTPTPKAPSCTGDYDICKSCYHDLVKSGRISRDAGPAGWRKCPSGHRMIVTVFEPPAADGSGQRRVIQHDLVGGVKMSAEDVDAWQAALDSAATPPSTYSARGGQWTWRDTTDPAEEQSGTQNSERRTTRTRKATLPTTGGILTGSEGAKNSRFPPEGGFGKRCLALWSYYPEEGEEGQGELLFPKGAEVGEVEDINGEWAEGVYAGERGLLPLIFVREI